MTKFLVLSLGRTGSLPYYAETLFKKFSHKEKTVIVSKYRLVKTPLTSFKEIITYKNKFSFIFNTITYLPFLAVKYVPKIIFTYDTLFLPYKHFWDIPFIFLFKLFNKKVVFVVHDGVLHKGEKNFITQGLNNYRLKKADKTIFLSEHTKKNVEKKLNIKTNSIIVSHPIISNKHIKIKNRDTTTNNFLFLGRIDKYKGVELLIESALGVINNIDKLVIAGKSNYSFKPPKNDKIEIRNKYLTDKEIATLLNWADILVLPYKEATQSGVIALGVYSELPMICTNVGGLPEQLSQDECFWCDPTITSLQNAIVASSNRSKRRDIKEKLALKKKKMSWEEAARKIEKIILD